MEAMDLRVEFREFVLQISERLVHKAPMPHIAIGVVHHRRLKTIDEQHRQRLTLRCAQGRMINHAQIAFEPNDGDICSLCIC
jgi:hypothetical protein